MVDFKSLAWKDRMVLKEYITPALIVEAAKSLPDSSSVDISELEAQDVIVDFSTMHYGMKDKNPLDFVKFYSKRIPDSMCIFLTPSPHGDMNISLIESANAGPGDYSTLMPECHAEVLLRIFTKKAEYFGIIQAAYRACLAGVPGPKPDFLLGPLFAVEDSTTSVATPSTEPAPSTPRTRTFSRHASFTAIGSTTGGGLTPFSNNSFTTVPTTFVPSSPSRGNRKQKRPRDVSPGKGDEVLDGVGTHPDEGGPLKKARTELAVDSMLR